VNDELKVALKERSPYDFPVQSSGEPLFIGLLPAQPSIEMAN
jgi:hypothetical protein